MAHRTFILRVAGSVIFVAALCLSIGASPAFASCDDDDRPGTPNHLGVKVAKDGVSLSWQNRASEGSMFYDVEVYNEKNQKLLNYSGVRDNPTLYYQLVYVAPGSPDYFCRGDTDTINGQTVYCQLENRQFARFAEFGQTASFKLPPFALGRFWFRVRARTEGGTKGCVSKYWAAPTWGTNVIYPYFFHPVPTHPK